MVDNKVILFKTKQYALVQYTNPVGEIVRKFVYADGKDLKYGDKAEILGSVLGGVNFLEFISGALSETYFSREHYWFRCGYQPADFENEEIQENEVQIHYAGVDNTIAKKEFYELCLLVCEAKMYSSDYKEEFQKELLSMKSKLEEKIKNCSE